MRLLESTWRRSRTDDNRISYTKLRDQYCRTLASTKAAFYSKEIESASNDNRAMFCIANHLLGRKCMNLFPNDTIGPDAVADRFAYHFADRITSIRSQTQCPSANVDNAQPCTVSSPLLAFQPASLEEVTTLIENGKTKLSMIDPLPIAILKANTSILAPANIRDLGVQLDSTMSMAAHVSRTCRTAYAQLRGIARIRSSLPLRACKTLVHALVTPRLDFGNAALCGITGTLLHRLEMVQRSAARVVLCLRRRDQHSMTTAIRELHWRPVAQRIQFKLLTLMHDAVHANTLRYLAARSLRSLRSADQSLIVVPRVNLERLGRRAFSCAGPTLWNSLPIGLRTQPDSKHFKRDLKTFLFNQAFS